MRRLATFLGVLIGIALWVGSSLADPPKVGTIVPFEYPKMCNDFSYLEEIVSAKEPETPDTIFSKFTTKIDKKLGLPFCGTGHSMFYEIVEVIRFPNFFKIRDVYVYGWAVKIRGMPIDFWILNTESVPLVPMMKVVGI